MTDISKRDSAEVNTPLLYNTNTLRSDSRAPSLGDGDGAAVAESDDGSVSVDAALDRIGTRMFHFRMLFVCGIVNAADASELMALSFLLPTTAQCDYELTTARKGWLNSSLFIGMIVGGMLWGGMSDQYGRKRSLVVALLLNGVCALGSAFIPAGHFEWFFVLRIISGIGVGGGIPIVFAYFSEFVPSYVRGSFLVGLASFWMVGQIFAASCAWSIIGFDECSYNNELTREENCVLFAEERCETYNVEFLGGDVPAWRFFIFSAGTPALLAVALLLCSPESPKWQMVAGKKDKALRTVKKIFNSKKRCCGKTKPGDCVYLSADEIILSVPADDDNIEVNKGKGKGEPQPKKSGLAKMVASFGAILRGVTQMYRQPYTRNAVLLTIVWVTLCFGFYGVSLWLPEYYSRNDISTDEIGIYAISFFNALSNLPGNFISLWSVDSKYVGSIWTLIVSITLSAISVFGILMVDDFTGTLIASCVFNGVSVAAWNALNIVTTDAFPTKHRGLAYGTLASAGRVAAIGGQQTFGLLTDTNDALPLTITAAMLAIGAVACYFIKDTRKLFVA